MTPSSIHVRAFLIWLAIFPLVAIAFSTVLPLMGSAAPILKVFVLTILGVPTAVYLVVPNLMKLYFFVKGKNK